MGIGAHHGSRVREAVHKANKQQYAELFPNDAPDAYGLRLAQQFREHFTALKAMVAPLRTTIEGLPDLDRLTREVRVPGGAASMLRICRLARQIATSDDLFPPMSQQSLQATLNVGHILRACRKAGLAPLERHGDAEYWKRQLWEHNGWPAFWIRQEAGAVPGGGAIPGGRPTTCSTRNDRSDAG